MALAPAMAALVALGWAATGRADFEVKIYEDGNAANAAVYKATGGSATTGFSMTISTGSTSNASLISGAATAYKDFTISGLNFTSNSPITSPSKPTSSSLSLSSSLIMLNSGTHSLTVLASDNGFSFPTGTKALLNSTEGYTASGTTGGDSYKFQSFATPDADLFDTTHTASPGYTFNLAATPGNHNETTKVLTFTPSNPYTMTFEATYNAVTDYAVFQPTGAASVVAGTVPEPASAAMLVAGSLGAAGFVRRRRAR